MRPPGSGRKLVAGPQPWPRARMSGLGCCHEGLGPKPRVFVRLHRCPGGLLEPELEDGGLWAARAGTLPSPGRVPAQWWRWSCPLSGRTQSPWESPSLPHVGKSPAVRAGMPGGLPRAELPPTSRPPTVVLIFSYIVSGSGTARFLENQKRKQRSLACRLSSPGVLAFTPFLCAQRGVFDKSLAVTALGTVQPEAQVLEGRGCGGASRR